MVNCYPQVLKYTLSHTYTPCLEPVYAGTGPGRAWSPLGSEAALREAASLPLSRWRAPAIIAWLELALGMPQYAAAVADNVKSGKVSNLMTLTVVNMFTYLVISKTYKLILQLDKCLSFNFIFLTL